MTETPVRRAPLARLLAESRVLALRVGAAVLLPESVEHAAETSAYGRRSAYPYRVGPALLAATVTLALGVGTALLAFASITDTAATVATMVAVVGSVLFFRSRLPYPELPPDPERAGVVRTVDHDSVFVAEVVRSLRWVATPEAIAASDRVVREHLAEPLACSRDTVFGELTEFVRRPDTLGVLTELFDTEHRGDLEVSRRSAARALLHAPLRARWSVDPEATRSHEESGSVLAGITRAHRYAPGTDAGGRRRLVATAFLTALADDLASGAPWEWAVRRGERAALG